MKRYLTPSKVALLSLISLYCDSAVPRSATIPILSFIVGHLAGHNGQEAPPQASASKGRSSVESTPTSTPVNSNLTSKNTHGPMISIQDFQKVLSGHQAASTFPGRSVWDLFVAKLWSISSLDALYIFFEELESLLGRNLAQKREDAQNEVEPPDENTILLSRSSMIGIFVRRALLEFSRMHMHDSITLWKRFVRYRQPTHGAWTRRNPSADQSSLDSVLSQLDLEDDSHPLARLVYGDVSDNDGEHDGQSSMEELERLLEFQVERMEKTGSRLSDEMRQKLRGMLDGDIPAPNLANYMKFLDAWKAGDYPSSFDHLHRYFDYNMQKSERQLYQYALLSLASLQADYGCLEEAITAIHETISVARENKDTICLNFALEWLHRFGKANPKEMSKAGRGVMLAVEREALSFLKTKAKETTMWGIWSSTLLSEAQLAMNSGDSVPLIFENVLKCAHLNITRGSPSSVFSQKMLHSALWARLGMPYLALSTCSTFKQCYGRETALGDVLKVTCRSATLAVQKGHYDEAEAQMQAVDPACMKVLRNYQLWTVFSGYIKLKRALNRNDLNAAEYLLNQVRSDIVEDPEFRFEIEILYIEYLRLTRRTDEGLAHLEKIGSELEAENRGIQLRVRILILKAVLLDHCGLPQKGFSIAIRAASTAWRGRLMPELWHAMCAVCSIIIQLREFEAATKILCAIMPHILECEEAAVSASGYSLLSDASIGQAGAAEPQSSRRKEFLTKASEYVDHSFTEYSHIENIPRQCEMMAKKATIMQVMGEHALANDYAARYHEIKRRAREGS